MSPAYRIISSCVARCIRPFIVLDTIRATRRRTNKRVSFTVFVQPLLLLYSNARSQRLLVAYSYLRRVSRLREKGSCLTAAVVGPMPKRGFLGEIKTGTVLT